ncbi:MAG: HDOD domain-containing protein [Chitinivibrionales bacterium]|nr:HDOD domain-containing protein [Chitinivibrionales bacterium]
MNSSLSSANRHSPNPETAYLVRCISNLPTLSPVLHRISALISDPQANARSVAEALKLDPAITGKVLRLANSAYIGIPRTVSSLHNAIVLLGTKRIYSLVMAASLMSSFRKSDRGSLNLMNYWRHSMTTALVAESIAKHIKRYEDIDSEEVFTAGIVHDIGKLVLGGYDPEELSRVNIKAAEQQLPFFEAEEPQVSHTLIGGYLADHWNFPDDLGEAITCHHLLTRAEAHLRLVSIIHVADIMVHMLGYQTHESELIPQLHQDALASVKIVPERLKVIAQDVVKNAKQLEALINFMA